MRIVTTVRLMAVITLAASLSAYAQGTNGATGNSSAQGGVSQGGQHQRPTPEQWAQNMMDKFDANKDGSLSAEELTKALSDMRERHPRGGNEGEQAGQNTQPPSPPPADKAAAQMIEKFSSDKKGLTLPELTKALEERRASHGHRGGGQSTSTSTTNSVSK